MAAINFQTRWLKTYEAAKQFFEEHGHFPDSTEKPAIRCWANNWWRGNYLANPLINKDKAEMLLSIGYTPRKPHGDNTWEARYEEAKAFFERNGHFPATAEHNRLHNWAVHWWRTTYRNNPSRHQDKADRLTAIGFEHKSVDEMFDALWQANFEKAKAFSDEYGHFPTKNEDFSLYKWARSWWRNSYAKHPEKYQAKADRLTAIGFDYCTDRIWMRNFEKAKAFYDEYGRFPGRTDNPTIYNWARTWWQRSLAGPDRHQAKVDLLRSIGFDFTFSQADDEKWDKQYRAARAFFVKHGYFPTYKHDKALYIWARKCTVMYRLKPALYADKMERLRQIGYIAGRTETVHDFLWSKNYGLAVQFFERNGHFPTRRERQHLRSWADKWWCEDYLSDPDANRYKADLLRMIGYEYSEAEDVGREWMRRYEEARTFFERHGHFPTSCEDYDICTWAYTWWRGTFLRNEHAHAAEADMLHKIGFTYNHQDDVWRKNYDRCKKEFETSGQFPYTISNLRSWARTWWKNTYLADPEANGRKAAMLRNVGFDYDL